MTEINGVIWILVGFIVGGVSFFLAFIRHDEAAFLFKITFYMGLGAIGYGLWKLIGRRKIMEKKLEEKKQQRYLRESQGIAPVNPEQGSAQRGSRSGPFSQSVSSSIQTHTSHHSEHNAAQFGGQATYQQPVQRPHQVQPQHPAHASQQYAQHQQPVHPSQHPTHPRHVVGQLGQHPQQHQVAQNVVYCPACGAQLHANQRFCSQCGTRLT